MRGALRIRFDRFWLLLLVLPPLLILPNLGNIFLWQDEAETALLARSVLRTGVPLAHDGRRTISDQPGAPGVNDEGLWIWTPWLQHYAAAASFAVLGESNAAARLPFALAGWGAILASYGLFRSLAARVATARIAVLLLTTSVPFLLQVRQCRYYAFVALFNVVYLWAYLRLARGRRGAAALFVTAGIGLYHTLLPQLVASTLAVGLDALANRRDGRLVRRVVACSGLVAALSLPFFVYTQGWSRDYLGRGHGFDSPARYAASLRAYLVAIHLYAWPFLWAVPALLWAKSGLQPNVRRAWRTLLVAAALLWPLAATAPPSVSSFGGVLFLGVLGGGAALALGRNAEHRRGNGVLVEGGTGLIALCLVIGVGLQAALASAPYYRYLTGLLPLFALATAVTLERLARGRMAVVVGLVLAMALVDLIQRAPFWVANGIHRATGVIDAEEVGGGMPLSWSLGGGETNALSFLTLGQATNRFPSNYWLLQYAGELTLDYDGPVEAVVRHLWMHARRGDSILVRYEHFPFMYYTDLDVLRWDEASSLDGLPDWIFFHGFQRGRLPLRIRQHLDRYVRVPLEAREYIWENLPEPQSHLFTTLRAGPPLELYRLPEGPALRDEGSQFVPGE